MNQLLNLPDWAPDWLGAVLLIFGGLFALAFLLMPFTVFSLKSRLDQIELKLEDLLVELRAMAPPPPLAARVQAGWTEPPPAQDRYPVHPPIPPRPVADRAPIAEPKRETYPQRSEPKLNWPR